MSIMLKRDKNSFINIIKSAGLDPMSFKSIEKNDVDGHPAFILQLKNSPLFFMCRTHKDDYHYHDSRHIKFAPSFPKSEYAPRYELRGMWRSVDENDPYEDWESIVEVYSRFDNWLKEHVNVYLEEIELPNLWEQLDESALFTSDPLSNRNNDHFSKPQMARITTSLDEFKRLVEIEFKPSPDQIEEISDRLDYLTESLNRLNKVDWQSVALTTVISISIALSLDTEKGKKLFDLFKQAFTIALEFIK